MKAVELLLLVVGFLFGAATFPLSNALIEEITRDSNNQPTPAVRPVESDLVLGLAELATDEHRGRLAAERTLDEFKQHAQSVVQKLLNEIQRLQKRPTLKKGSIGA